VAAFHYPTSHVDGEQLLLQLHSQPNIKHSIELLLNPNPPDDVAPASIMWDPTIIQTLGLYQTTLDDQEEDVEGSISGESALSESEVGCSSYEGSTPTPICLLQPDTVVCTPFHSLYLPIS
jgi:hypothetical protein